MALFRRRFTDLIARQLDLFAVDNVERLRELDETLAAHRRADVEDAEETYGDFQDQVDWASSDLLAIRDGYASTLDAATQTVYERAFGRAAAKRFPALAGAIASEDVD